MHKDMPQKGQTIKESPETAKGMFGELKRPLLCQGVRCILKNKTSKTLESSGGRTRRKWCNVKYHRQKLICISQFTVFQEIIDTYPESLWAG